jgi:tetratricopeptide (TPR) repeat protein
MFEIFSRSFASLRSAIGNAATIRKDFAVLRAADIAQMTRWRHLDLHAQTGEGAFGAVFRAWDENLQRAVALKLIRCDQMDRDSVFLEARLLAKLRHSNIVEVYGAELHAGWLGVWMDFIDGETLTDLVRQRGPLSAREAALLCSEVCRAVSAAHGAGVLHRDIKPDNVMRERGGRVVLVDFGLGVEIAFSPVDEIAGTLCCIAPEVLNGARPTVESDVYSLGVLLYFLTTSTYPVTGTLEEVQAAHESSRMRLLRDARADLPDAFLRIVERATENSPGRRYHSAGRMHRDLTDFLESGFDHRLAGPEGLKRRTVIATVGLLAAAYLGWSRWSQRGAALPEGSGIVVVPFENSTGDGELDGVTHVITHQLGLSGHINVVDDAQVRETLERMGNASAVDMDPATARQVAWRGGFPLVLFGSLSRQAGELLLQLRLELIGSQPVPRRQWRMAFPAQNKDELFRSIQGSIRWVRATAGEAESNIEQTDRHPEDATTPSWRALALLREADRRRAADREEEAVLLLRQAVDIDPHFASAYMRLGDILFSLYRYPEGVECWQRAIKDAVAGRLSKREELRIRAQYAEDTGDKRGALAAYDAYAAAFPSDFHGWFYRASVLAILGQNEAAINSALRAERLEPKAHAVVYHVSRLYLATGRLAEASQKIRRLRDLGRSASADALDASLHFLQGSYSSAVELYRRLRSSEDSYWCTTSYLLEGCVYAELGQYNAARSALSDGLANMQPSGRLTARAEKLIALAYLELQSANLEPCRVACEEALLTTASFQHVAAAGALLARAGFPDIAENAARKLRLEVRLPRLESALHRVQGEILLVAGHAEEAKHEFLAASRIPIRVAKGDELARALERSSDLDGALEQVREIAVSPGAIWQQPEAEFPGSWADSLFQLGRLSVHLQKPNAESNLRRYLQLRQGADPSLPQVAAARKLLQGVRPV